MVQVVLATRNSHKVGELRDILEAAGIATGAGGIELLSLEQADALPTGPVPDIPETGTTFEANALLKARAVAAHTGLPAISDDSGLCVDVLGGSPGIFSARWAGRHGDDAANLDLVLAQIADVAAEHRGANFTCAAALALPDGTEQVCLGVITGTLRTERAGAGGFGYDPIFEPEGYAITTAQMSPAEKNAISHRGRAFAALAEHLAKLVER